VLPKGYCSSWSLSWLLYVVGVVVIEYYRSSNKNNNNNNNDNNPLALCFFRCCRRQLNFVFCAEKEDTQKIAGSLALDEICEAVRSLARQRQIR
jgi:hypothetical protein